MQIKVTVRRFRDELEAAQKDASKYGKGDRCGNSNNCGRSSGCGGKCSK